MTIQMFAQCTIPMQFSKRVVKLKRTKPSVGDPLEQREVHNTLDGANAREEPIRVPEARTLACTIGLPTPLTINPEPSMGSDDEEDALSFGKEVQGGMMVTLSSPLLGMQPKKQATCTSLPSQTLRYFKMLLQMIKNMNWSNCQQYWPNRPDRW
jgi:hypothetical protein